MKFSAKVWIGIDARTNQVTKVFKGFTAANNWANDVEYPVRILSELDYFSMRKLNSCQ